MKSTSSSLYSSAGHSQALYTSLLKIFYSPLFFKNSFKMHSKAVLITLLVACASATSAYDFNGAAPSEKRCLGGCGNTNQGGSTTNSNTSTDASTKTTNTVVSIPSLCLCWKRPLTLLTFWQNTSGSGNQDTANNNGGGQDFSGMNFSGMQMGCKRAYLEGRAYNKRNHHEKVKGTQKPGPKNVNVSNKSTNIATTNTNNQQNSNNKVNTNKSTVSIGPVFHTSVSTDTNFSPQTVNAQKTNNANQSHNSGVIMGSGTMCRREFIDLELERRELDTGASVVAALGGLSARDAHGHEEMLATRDVGKMALMLGVRAFDHDEDADFYKRNVGVECATEECNEMMRREAEELLYIHARDLGLVTEDDGEY